MSKQVRDIATEEIQEILKKYGLKFSYDITFPIYNILPDEVKLALSVLEKHGMNITISYKEKKK